MKNPLRKRVPRELREEWGKYLAIFLLLTLTIGFVSGFLVADGSMIAAYRESFTKYNVEDGNFRTASRLTEEKKKKIQDQGVSVYENFYVEKELDNGSALRIFQNREETDKVCLMEGAMPAGTWEIGLDRMYAENNGLKIGDTVSDGEHVWIIAGLVALPDYSCLFQDNNDSMFDAVKFGVAVTTKEGFGALGGEKLQYNYAWIYDSAPSSEKQEKEESGELMKFLAANTDLKNFVPRYLNQAIRFTGDDMGSDRAMILMLLYMVMAILAFVSGVAVSSTIRREAGAIGTLRASGYTRWELGVHYMTAPVLTTLAGALVGNLLGYTVFKNLCAAMYYGSYSLPTYETVWNAQAFLLTTLVPAGIMLAVNAVILRYRLRLSPLKFLRRDLSGRKRAKAVYLSVRIPIFRRFCLRVLFQNLGNYLVLLAGVLFANLLLMFGLLLPSALEHYQREIRENMLAKYQYMLEAPLGASGGNRLEAALALLRYKAGTITDNPEAEKFSAYSLETLPGKYKSEAVLLYGAEPGSRYIRADWKEGEVYISRAYAEKYRIKPGDSVTLKEKYEDGQYTFKVGGIYDYTAALCVFMPRSVLNETFGLGEDFFAGYFSDTEITDIDETYIASVVDLDALTKITRQLDVSMGSMMGLVNGFAVIIFLVVISLLSRVVIEKNVPSISMAKILGYTDGEIGRLYILPTSIALALCLLVSLPAERAVMEVLFREMMLASISGWITLWVDPAIYVKMFLTGAGAYAAAAFFEYRRVRRIPKDEVLKNVE